MRDRDPAEEWPVPQFKVRTDSDLPADEFASRLWPQPIRHRLWTSPDGTEWRLRGHSLPDRQLLKLAANLEVPILLIDGPEPRLLDGDDRRALLGRMAEVFAGSSYPQHVIDGAEFRDVERRRMLIVVEGC